MRALVLSVLVLFSGSVLAQTCPPPRLPSDLQLVCYEGRLHLVSFSAEQVIPLPVSCT